MSSKVTAKLRLGAAFSVLLISLALLAGCKQEASVDNVDNNSYTPPEYEASVGYLTDTVWKDKAGNTISFGPEGKVTVPESWKSSEVLIPNKDSSGRATGSSIKVNFKFDDFTYNGSTISCKAIEVQVDNLSREEQALVNKELKNLSLTKKAGEIVQFASITPTNYDVEVTVKHKNISTTFDMENEPTSGDKFVGTYYDGQGRKKIQINDDNTFVTFSEGGRSVQYWKYKTDGIIHVKATPFDGSANEFSGGLDYYLYPHALMSGKSTTAWK